VRTSNGIQARACAPLAKAQQSRLAFKDALNKWPRLEGHASVMASLTVLHDAAGSTQALTQ